MSSVYKKKKLKDVDGTYLLTPSSLDLVFDDEGGKLIDKLTSINEKLIQKANLSDIRDMATQSYVNDKIAEVDLSGYQTKEDSTLLTSNKTVTGAINEVNQKVGSKAPLTHTHQADQVTFTDGQTFQQKFDDGSLKGGKGDKGDKGDRGDNGVTYTPSVDSSGILSWVNDGNLQSPDPVNIKGAKGDKGDKGDKGEPGTTSWNDIQDKPNIPSIEGLATETYVNDKITPKLTGNSTTGKTLTLTIDKYQYTVLSNGDSIVLPSVSSFTEIHLFFKASADLTLTFPSVKWQSIPSITSGHTYEIIFTYVVDEWLAGVICYE